MPKTSVEHIKGNEKSYFYLYLVQGSFEGGFYVCIK